MKSDRVSFEMAIWSESIETWKHFTLKAEEKTKISKHKK